MKTILIVGYIFFSAIGFSQSFVFCPEIEIENEILITGSANIVFIDNRTYEKKLKEKCGKDEIFTCFANYIEKSFPNLNITFLDERKFYDNPIDSTITFKINLKRLDATFYTGMWVSFTEYSVEIFDLRKGNNYFEYEFNGKGSQFNTFGKKSGKKAFNASFKRAYIDFTSIFEKSINNKLVSPNTTNEKSKADQLRELKKLLDEGILTQEEFESEKMKILDEKY